MEPLHWLILAGITLAVVIVLACLLFRREEKELSFSAQRFFVSGQQRKFWQALQKAVGNEYMVLAKVPLPALIQSEGDAKDGDWLNNRWVDFAIFEEKFLKPVAVVQFERQEKEPLWALGKDPSLQKVLAAAKLALLWLPSEHYQHVELLRHALSQILGAPTRPEG